MVAGSGDCGAAARLKALAARLDRHFEEALCGLLLTALMTLLIVQTLGRFLLNLGFPWMEELIRYLFVWFIYLGAALGVQRQGHIRVTAAVVALPSRALRRAAILLADLCWLGFNLAIVLISIEYIERVMRFPQASPALGITTWWVQLVIPVSFALMSLRLVQLYLRHGVPETVE